MKKPGKKRGNPKPVKPQRGAIAWEQVSFKVLPEMKQKIKADMVVANATTEAEYFRFLLRMRFERPK
jgi:hypothetical protein